MEKLTEACSLRGSCVILFVFPFSVGIFCWAELEPHSEATYGRARPSNYALVWQSGGPKWGRGCVLVSVHLLSGKIIFSKPSEIWLNDHFINNKLGEPSHVQHTLWNPKCQRTEANVSCFSHQLFSTFKENQYKSINSHKIFRITPTNVRLMNKCKGLC